MGSGGKKAHEAITISPASGVPAAVSDPPQALVDEVKQALANNVTTEAELETFVEPAELETNEATDPVAAIDLHAPPPIDDSEIVTPIPTEVTAGDMRGHPLIVGGDDLDDSTLTLTSYLDPQGGDPREVLYGWVNPSAEEKLLEALALDEEQLVPVEIEKHIEGRLPLDEDHQLYEQLVTVVKSVNHHLKAEDGIPDHTHDNHQKLVAQLADLAESATDAESEMLAVYQSAAEQLGQRLAADWDKPYDDGGKVPHIDSHEVSQTVTVTEMVPAPSEEAPAGLLAAKIRNATRIKPTLDEKGRGSWDGKTRHTGQGGKEYRIELGEGYEAIYRPSGGSDATKMGHRGFLEVLAPAGSGHGPELVRRLGQLNLVNRPMTAAEAEWSYLRRNVWAQHLDKDHTVAAALSAAEGLDDTVTELVLAERAHEAVGLDDAQLHGFAKEVRLEAEARALPEKTRLVRDAIATHLGYHSGKALAESAGYDPTPHPAAGWFTWSRFDVAAEPAKIGQQFGNRVLYHRVTGNNLVDMFTNSAALTATERRRVMGVNTSLGMSEGSDMTSGGSRSVFLRVGKPSTSGVKLVWNPAKLLQRADWYAYNGDHFGATSSEGSWSTHGQTRDPAKVSGFTASNNEIMFRNGIDLLGAQAPDRILCGSEGTRNTLIDTLKNRGIAQLGGRPIEKVIKA